MFCFITKTRFVKQQISYVPGNICFTNGTLSWVQGHWEKEPVERIKQIKLYGNDIKLWFSREARTIILSWNTEGNHARFYILFGLKRAICIRCIASSSATVQRGLILKSHGNRLLRVLWKRPQPPSKVQIDCQAKADRTKTASWMQTRQRIEIKMKSQNNTGLQDVIIQDSDPLFKYTWVRA